MIGILLQLALSWLLLWLFEKKDLSVLGFRPTKGRLADLAFGFAAAAACFTTYCLTTTALAGNSWKLNEGYGLIDLASSSWWSLRSVLFEELIFRGALLYILIEKTSIRTACLISAAAFGIYHWIS